MRAKPCPAAHGRGNPTKRGNQAVMRHCGPGRLKAAAGVDMKTLSVNQLFDLKSAVDARLGQYRSADAQGEVSV